MHKKRSATGLRPDPQGEFTALPQTIVLRGRVGKGQKGGEGRNHPLPPIPGSATEGCHVPDLVQVR